MAADHLRRRENLKNCSLNYYVHAPVIFGVPFFARELVKIAARYGIESHYQHNLVAVDGPLKTATFERVASKTKASASLFRSTCCTFLRPKAPPRRSSRAHWSTRRAGSKSTRIRSNACVTPTYSRSAMSVRRRIRAAAAVRKQAPVVVDNILHMIGKAAVEADRRLCVMPTDHSFRQGHISGVHLRRESHAYPVARPRQEVLGSLVDQSDRPAVDVLELHVEGHVWFPEHNTAFKGDVV